MRSSLSVRPGLTLSLPRLCHPVLALSSCRESSQMTVSDRLRQCHFLAVAAVLLGACGGGGSIEDTGSGTLPPPDPLAAPQPASNFESSADYDPCFLATDLNTYCNAGLGQIGAADVYAMGAYGSGVVVAVVDSGIEPTHPELDSKISAASTDIVLPGTPMADDIGHGTMVAGVIAAERNNFWTHGVAFGSTILAVRTDGRNLDGTTTDEYLILDVASGIAYAAGKAHVINLSLGVAGTQLGDPLGTPVEQDTFVNALVHAMSSGAIVVAATGNEGATEAALPAAYAGDATVNASGQMLAVGSVNHDATDIATFSNHCGQAMNYCLVAPGDGLWTTVTGGDLGYVYGTSFSAPHVSGAAALLIQLWPTLTPAQVVNIMLTSATDMGDVGVDSVFGHGLLNLPAAIAPAGSLEIPLAPLADGGGPTVENTMLTLDSSFGDALTDARLLSQAFALDDYDRNYAVDLSDLISRADIGFGLNALVARDRLESIDAELPNGMKVAMGVSDTGRAESAAEWSGMAIEDGGIISSPELHGMSLEIDGVWETSFRLGYDVTPEQQTVSLASSEPAGLFWMPGNLLGPQYGLAGAGTGLTLSRRIGESSIVSAGWLDQRSDPDITEADAELGDVTLAHRFGNGAIGYAGISMIDERNGFLGGAALGGFAVAGTESLFYSVGGRYPLDRGFELVGSYTTGEAEISADRTGLLSEWNGIRADAFGIGLVKNGVLGPADRIGLLAGQPLRVNAGEARLTVPVEYLPDKTVVSDSERVSMAPSGRQYDLQLAYASALGENASFSTYVMMQLEPGHVARAAPAYGAGIRFSAEF